jgi:hypothetical protein
LMALKIDPTWGEIPWIVKVAWLWENIKFDIYKVKKMRCFSISKNSKDSWLRIIYLYEEKTWKIEFQRIEFIEIYHKNNKLNHDIDRIKDYY